MAARSCVTCCPDMRLLLPIKLALVSVLLGACASNYPEMETVDYVDLERFMGDWYVIANIPTFVEKGAHNAVENYALNPDGTVATTFTFRKDSFDGKLKTYTPKGFVQNTETNALWGMQFIWPIKGDFRIVYLDDDYSQTIVARLRHLRDPEGAAALVSALRQAGSVHEDCYCRYRYRG